MVVPDAARKVAMAAVAPNLELELFLLGGEALPPELAALFQESQHYQVI